MNAGYESEITILFTISQPLLNHALTLFHGLNKNTFWSRQRDAKEPKPVYQQKKKKRKKRIIHVEKPLQKSEPKNKNTIRKMFPKMSILRKILILFFVILIISTICDCRRLKNKRFKQKAQKKQLPVSELRETSTPDFVRLLVMRLIYGIATQMGLEERLAGFLNGAFVPPSAEDDDYGFDLGGDDFDGGDLFDL